MTNILLFPLAAALPPCSANTSADEQSSAAFISSSSGGVEGHAAVPLEIPTQRSGASRDPLGDGSVKVGPHREDAAGIKPGPLDPLCNAPTAVSIRLTKRVSRPEPGPGAERPGFILDVQKFNAALAAYGEAKEC